MNVSKLAEYLQKLEETTKRLEITDILMNMISEAEPVETDLVINLSLGYLTASYQNTRFNMADKMVMKAIALTLGKDLNFIQKEYAVLGDLGLLMEKNYSKQAHETLSITDLHKELSEIANLEGTGSQDNKIQKLTTLLKKLDNKTAKYVVKIVLGTTRLGFTEITICEALAKYIGNKELKEQIEQTYNIHPDIGRIGKEIRQTGNLESLKLLEVETGVPVMPQRCQRLTDAHEILEKMGEVYVEYKLDGTRVQMHLDKSKVISKTQTEAPLQPSLFGPTELFNEPQTPSKSVFVKTYTRGLEESTHQFPDLVEACLKQVKATSAILDGEAIGYDPKTGEFLPFQEMIQRKRKHNISQLVMEVPLKYFVFDILYLNGKSLINEPLSERKRLLREIIEPGGDIEINEYPIVNDPDKLDEMFEESVGKNLEGLVIKKPNDPYQAGARSFSWIKWKKADKYLLEDTIDAAVLGYYFGRGARSKFGLGGFLVGVYDKNANTIKTITKVGTGLTDDEWYKLKAMADKLKIDKKDIRIDSEKIYDCEVWLTPEIIVELGADEISQSKTHSAGYALRFPRLIKFRDDKKLVDTTTIEEITRIFSSQGRGKS